MSNDAHIPTAAEPLIQASLLGEAVDPGPVAIFVADEQMRYVAVNAYAAELLGYTRAELLELRVTDVVRTPEATEHFDEVVAHRHRDGIALLTRKNGSVFQLGYRARETTVAGMPLYVSVGWPILGGLRRDRHAELEALARAVECCTDEVAEERRRARRP